MLNSTCAIIKLSIDGSLFFAVVHLFTFPLSSHSPLYEYLPSLFDSLLFRDQQFFGTFCTVFPFYRWTDFFPLSLTRNSLFDCIPLMMLKSISKMIQIPMWLPCLSENVLTQLLLYRRGYYFQL